MPAPHLEIDDVNVGDRHVFRRSITADDLREMVRLTGDRGGYHVDERFARAAGFRTVITPGLVQAGMATKVGGELNFLAQEITFRYHRPVYVGDTLEAVVEITTVDRGRRRITLETAITNQHGETVLTSTAQGFLPKADWGIPDKRNG